MRLVQCHSYAGDTVRAWTQGAAANCRCNAAMEHMSEKFGRGVATLELRDFVQIAVVELSEQRLQELRGPADVDDHTIRVELATELVIRESTAPPEAGPDVP